MAKVEAVQIRPETCSSGQAHLALLKSTTSTSRPRRRLHAGRDEGHRGRTKTNQRFRTEDKVERAFVDPRDMEYLYSGRAATYSWTRKLRTVVAAGRFPRGQAGYLLPNTDVQINFLQRPADRHRNSAFVVLTVVDTERHKTHRHQYFQAAKMRPDHGFSAPFINKARRSSRYQRSTYMERA